MNVLQQSIAWITNGEVGRFYTSWPWKKLSAEVKYKHNNECQKCKSGGKYRHATLVHHVKPIKEYPELCLSKTFTDEEGNEQRQLIPLCGTCHEQEHPERLKQYKKKNEIAIERWD